MSVSFHNGELHLPNGQAMDLLLAIGVPGPIQVTHGEMPMDAAIAGAQAAHDRLEQDEFPEPLTSNVVELLGLLLSMRENGVTMLEWS